MSLGLRVLTAIILLGAALGVKLSLDSAAAWRDARDAEMLRLLNAHATPLLDAEGALAAERGLTNGALANLAGTDAATRTAFIGQRARAQSARALALADFAGLPVASGQPVAEALAAEREAAGRLDAQRSTIDQILQRQAGAAPTQAEWFAAATAEIEAMTRLRRLIEAAGTDDPVLSRLIVVRDGLAEMAEYAGRERGRINGAIAADARLTAGDMAQLGVLRGHLEGAWAHVQAQAGTLPPAVADAVRAAGAAVFDTFQQVRAPVLAAASQAAAWPSTPNGWFTAATQAIAALSQAEARASEASDLLVQQRRRAGNASLAVALALLAGAIAITLATLWYLVVRVIRPLNGAVTALTALTAGDLDVAVPTPHGRDEVAALLHATLRFQTTARAHREMEAKQEVLRLEAEQGRAEAVRGVGELIERESAQAVGKVAGLAGQLRELSDRVDASVQDIAAAAATAAAAAGEGMRDSDTAASGARELAAAIAEIARQMDRTTETTRTAVSRADATRQSFDTLTTAVAEIDEVAHLIAEIAGRTNLPPLMLRISRYIRCLWQYLADFTHGIPIILQR